MKQLHANSFRLASVAFAAVAILCSPMTALYAQAPAAPTAPAATPDTKPADKAAAAEDPFAPQPAPPLPAGMTGSSTSDPRYSLKPGLYDAGEVASGMERVASLKKPAAFTLPSNDADDPAVQKALAQLGVGDRSKMSKSMQLVIAGLAFANSDFAFQGNHLFQGNFYGINFYDISNPAKVSLITSLVCPGGQGDVSVYGNLLFMSVEMANGRLDCGTQGFPPLPPPEKGHEKERRLPAASPDRFRGVRIFDITDIGNPKQVAAVQTCRGSHTHTLVVDPNDKDNVYIYVSGTSFVRQKEELAGCSGETPDKDPNTSLFRIDVIKVPIASPEKAAIVSSPRVFVDPRSGALNGLNNGGSHGKEEEKPKDTNQCHDITVYSAIGLAAGACSGNGILLDIKDPVHPKRVDAVNDPNYSYWHSASFSNDGTKVVFTDEWGGGLAARGAVRTTRTSGARTRSSTSRTISFRSPATTSCRAPSRTPKTAWPTMARSCPSPAAISKSRPGIRAEFRSWILPTPRIPLKSPTSTADPSIPSLLSSADSGRRIGTTATSTVPKSNAGSMSLNSFREDI